MLTKSRFTKLSLMPLKRSKLTLDTTQVSYFTKSTIKPYFRFIQYFLTIQIIVHLLKSKNQFGKLQSDIDIAADDIIFKHLKDSGVVFGAASEEKPAVSSQKFLVTNFDFIVQCS